MDPGALAARSRPDFPVLSRRIDGLPITYLDSAATSLKPRQVIDEVCRYYTDVSANIHRGKHMLSEEASDRYEEVRVTVARFLGCRAHEVVFVPNTTLAINLVAAGLGLRREDLVLCPIDSHHSNLLPWREAARVELIDLDASGRVDVDHFESLLRARPRVVALNHCSNVTGIVSPVEQMARMAKAAGATVVLDAAQSAPHRRLRMADLGVDFAAFSGHKMLGPTGVGVLFVSGGQVERMGSLPLGGGTVDRVTVAGHDLRRAPHRFEPGTPDVAGVFGLGAAVDYLNSLGMASVESHDLLMASVLAAEAERRPSVRMLGRGTPAVGRSGIASFAVEGCPDLAGIARILSDAHGVMCRTGHMCAQPLVDRLAGGQVLRMSTYLYNTVDEVRAAFSALDAVLARMGLGPAPPG